MPQAASASRWHHLWKINITPLGRHHFGGEGGQAYFIQVAGPMDCGVWITPVKEAGDIARIAASSKISPICDSTPDVRIASSHLR